MFSLGEVTDARDHHYSHQIHFILIINDMLENIIIIIKDILTHHLRDHNWIHFAHRPQYTVTLNSKFAIFKT